MPELSKMTKFVNPHTKQEVFLAPEGIFISSDEGKEIERYSHYSQVEQPRGDICEELEADLLRFPAPKVRRHFSDYMISLLESPILKCFPKAIYSGSSLMSGLHEISRSLSQSLSQLSLTISKGFSTSKNSSSIFSNPFS
eukprot:TRINITY_DN7053_c0_g1_i3.p3 TRINITY_DN7053_c0_g1~~TRINITY_DN7053_c0_g1_i3.p3  ORF type:complete len:140 (-),score=10.46 TRINITY_DN7053_c0_g1_i3:33-452(-)